MCMTGVKRRRKEKAKREEVDLLLLSPPQLRFTRRTDPSPEQKADFKQMANYQASYQLLLADGFPGRIAAAMDACWIASDADMFPSHALYKTTPAKWFAMPKTERDAMAEAVLDARKARFADMPWCLFCNCRIIYIHAATCPLVRCVCHSCCTCITYLKAAYVEARGVVLAPEGKRFLFGSFDTPPPQNPPPKLLEGDTKVEEEVRK